MDSLWTAAFWKATAERAIKTLAQALIVVLGGGVGLLQIDWIPALLGVASLVALSVLTSVASASYGPTGSPSLVSEGPVGRHELR